MIDFYSHSFAPQKWNTQLSNKISWSVRPFSPQSLSFSASSFLSTLEHALAIRQWRALTCAWPAVSHGSHFSTCGSAGRLSTRPRFTPTFSSLPLRRHEDRKARTPLSYQRPRSEAAIRHNPRLLALMQVVFWFTYCCQLVSGRPFIFPSINTKIQ